MIEILTIYILIYLIIGVILIDVWKKHINSKFMCVRFMLKFCILFLWPVFLCISINSSYKEAKKQRELLLLLKRRK